MKTKKLCALCLIITLISFLGFFIEMIWMGLYKGYINNRNMHLPFLLGYGLAIAAIYLIFGTPLSPRFFRYSLKTDSPLRNTFRYFLCVSLCVSAGECMLGTLIEKSCGITLWNYSKLPLNITKYTSVPTTIGFGLLITIFMKYLFMPIYNALMKLDDRTLYVLAAVFMTAMIADFLRSAIQMYQTRELVRVWRIDFRTE